MDVFGPQWENHIARLVEAWTSEVGEDDTVVVAGDIDWALRLQDAAETLDLLAHLPGNKILLRGNHDYWWSSKTTSKVRRALPATVTALHNSCTQADGFNVCGTKGSPVPGAADWTPENEKLLARELQRLSFSLEARDPELPTVVALHYPPFYGERGESPYREMLERHGVAAVMFGHLHGNAAHAAPRGEIDGIEYRLVAGDAVGFRPVRIGESGCLAGP